MLEPFDFSAYDLNRVLERVGLNAAFLYFALQHLELQGCRVERIAHLVSETCSQGAYGCQTFSAQRATLHLTLFRYVNAQAIGDGRASVNLGNDRQLPTNRAVTTAFEP